MQKSNKNAKHFERKIVFFKNLHFINHLILLKPTFLQKNQENLQTVPEKKTKTLLSGQNLCQMQAISATQE